MRRIVLIVMVGLLISSCDTESDKKFLCKTWQVKSYSIGVGSGLGLGPNLAHRNKKFHYPTEWRYIFNTDNTYTYMNIAEPWLTNSGIWNIHYGIKKELILKGDTTEQRFALMRLDENNLELNAYDLTLFLQTDFNKNSTKLVNIIPGKWKVTKSKIVENINGKYSYAEFDPPDLFYVFDSNKNFKVLNGDKIQEGEWSYKSDTIFIKAGNDIPMDIKLRVINPTDSSMISAFENNSFHYFEKCKDSKK